MTAGISSATDVRALRPSLAVMTLICSRCNVIWTILRTVGLSSTTNTVGSAAIYIDLLRTSGDQYPPSLLSEEPFQFCTRPRGDDCIESRPRATCVLRCAR